MLFQRSPAKRGPKVARRDKFPGATGRLWKVKQTRHPSHPPCSLPPPTRPVPDSQWFQSPEGAGVGTHRSPLIVDKSGYMEDSKVKGSGSSTPAKLCHPTSSPKTPDPLVPKPRPALVITVSRGNGQTFIHVSMKEAEDMATGHIAWTRSKGRCTGSWSPQKVWNQNWGPSFCPVASLGPGLGVCNLRPPFI